MRESRRFRAGAQWPLPHPRTSSPPPPQNPRERPSGPSIAQGARAYCTPSPEAPAEIGVNPTRNVPQSLRRQPALVTETPVHGDGVTISEVFNNHVQPPYNHPSPTAEKRSNSSATCLRCWKKSSSRIFSLGAWPLLCA